MNRGRGDSGGFEPASRGSRGFDGRRGIACNDSRRAIPELRCARTSSIGRPQQQQPPTARLPNFQ